MSALPDSVTLDVVRGRFEDFGQSIVAEGLAASFVVEDDDGVRLTLRPVDARGAATIEMSGSTEVFILELGQGYRLHETAYEPLDKWNVLAEFLEDETRYLRRNYFEEIYTRKGRIVGKVLRLGDDGERAIVSPSGLLDRARRLLGCEMAIRRP